MRRVRTIHHVRPLFSNAVLAGGLFVISLYVIGREVFVARVFENVSSVKGTVAVGKFFLEAFVSTEVIVQALVLLSGIAFLWLLRELAHTLRTPSPQFKF